MMRFLLIPLALASCGSYSPWYEGRFGVKYRFTYDLELDEATELKYVRKLDTIAAAAIDSAATSMGPRYVREKVKPTLKGVEVTIQRDTIQCTVMTKPKVDGKTTTWQEKDATCKGVYWNSGRIQLRYFRCPSKTAYAHELVHRFIHVIDKVMDKTHNYRDAYYGDNGTVAQANSVVRCGF